MNVQIGLTSTGFISLSRPVAVPYKKRYLKLLKFLLPQCTYSLCTLLIIVELCIHAIKPFLVELVEPRNKKRLIVFVFSL